MRRPLNEATRATGEALRAAGYTEAAVAHSLGLPGFTGSVLDGAWWTQASQATGTLQVLVDLFIHGARLPRRVVAAALPEAAWQARLVRDQGGDVVSTGLCLPLGDDLIWTDRADEPSKLGGLFLPDSSTWALRGCLPKRAVARHLDLGCGAGAVTVAAARTAQQTWAGDIEGRASLATKRSALLSGVEGVNTWTGPAEDGPVHGQFDRVSFVLPLLRPLPHHDGAPRHTVADDSGLLGRVIEAMPHMLAPGGIALLYTQAWPGGDRSLPEALHDAFAHRPWRGAFWWDHPGDPDHGAPRAGVLAVRAESDHGWVARQRHAAPSWDGLAALLDEG